MRTRDEFNSTANPAATPSPRIPLDKAKARRNMAMDGFHRARFCCSATRGRDDDRRRWARDTNHKMKVTRDEIFSPIAIFQGDDMILKRSYKKLPI